MGDEFLTKGLVVKSYAGHHFVQLEREPGVYSGPIVDAVLPGRFRQGYKTGARKADSKGGGSGGLFLPAVVVGDYVEVSKKGGSPVITGVIPRRTLLVRPLIANVDLVVVVFALASPDPSPGLVDRFLVQVHANGLTPLLCFNKVDLVGPDKAFQWERVYSSIGYKTVVTSAKSGKNIPVLQEALRGHLSCLAGPSGVGKSALLNQIRPGSNLKTGNVSARIGRGKHTTRHAELLPLAPPDGEEGVIAGWIADTPGFSSVDLLAVDEDSLETCFPEFDPAFLGNNCRFSRCRHLEEPGCIVKKAVRDGVIPESRYESYRAFLDELRLRQKW